MFPRLFMILVVLRWHLCIWSKRQLFLSSLTGFSWENFSLVSPHRNSARAIEWNLQHAGLVSGQQVDHRDQPGTWVCRSPPEALFLNSANENTLRNWKSPRTLFFFFVISFFRWTDYRLSFKELFETKHDLCHVTSVSPAPRILPWPKQLLNKYLLSESLSTYLRKSEN